MEIADRNHIKNEMLLLTVMCPVSTCIVFIVCFNSYHLAYIRLTYRKSPHRVTLIPLQFVIIIKEKKNNVQIVIMTCHFLVIIVSCSMS